jgi:hypothetical protein
MMTYSQSSNKTLIESLGKADTLAIQYHSVGNYDNMCGGERKNVMWFYYDGEKLIAETTKDEIMVKVDVDDKKKKFLIALEKESHLVDGRETFCETSSGYLYYLNSKVKFRIIDQTCKWFGFSKMTEELFGFKF